MNSDTAWLNQWRAENKSSFHYPDFVPKCGDPQRSREWDRLRFGIRLSVGEDVLSSVPIKVAR